MKTPICDFIEKYAQTDNVRLHMPGHKGVGDHNERLDITEITGADSLYEASGIIAESEKNASALFDAHTFYSAEGSSLSIRAMLYLCTAYAKEIGRRPLVLAARNAHKTFVSAVAMLDLDVEWMASASADYLSCKLSADEVASYLDRLTELPVAVYLTSPDYLGNIGLGDTVLKCYYNTVILKIILKEGDYLFIQKLLCEKKDNVILPFHLIGSERRDRDGHLYRTVDHSTVLTKSLNMCLIAVDKIYPSAVFGNVSAKHGTKRARAVYCISFHFNLRIRSNTVYFARHQERATRLIIAQKC